MKSKESKPWYRLEVLVLDSGKKKISRVHKTIESAEKTWLSFKAKPKTYGLIASASVIEYPTRDAARRGSFAEGTFTLNLRKDN